MQERKASHKNKQKKSFHSFSLSQGNSKKINPRFPAPPIAPKLASTFLASSNGGQNAF
jgi:hypothetical protein